MNKQKHNLILATVVETSKSSMFYQSVPTVEENTLIQLARQMLQSYSEFCNSANVECHLIIATGIHIGDTLCQIVDQRKIDVLIMGRRGMGTLKRMFVGSSSKYCTEQAKCSVMIIKKEWPVQEEQKLFEEIVQRNSTCTKDEAKMPKPFTVELLKLAS